MMQEYKTRKCYKCQKIDKLTIEIKICLDQINSKMLALAWEMSKCVLSLYFNARDLNLSMKLSSF